MTESPLAHLKMFQESCGPDFPQKTVLVTTMWSVADPENVLRHEEEIRAAYWRPMIDLGSSMIRFEDTTQSAWHAVDLLLTGGGRRLSN
jgi:hypothetical protein